MPIRACVMASALLGLLTLAPLHTAAACSLSSAHGVRWPGESHLIGIPTAVMVNAARGLPPALARVGPERSYHDRISTPRQWTWWRWRFKAGWRRLRNAVGLGPPYGQVVRLERVGGPDSLRVLAAIAQSGGEGVLVNWDLAASCLDVLSEKRETFLVPGERVFMTAALRDPAGWVDGRPTFDLRSTESPYAGRLRWYQDGSLAEPALALEKFWELYEALPAHGALLRDSAAALVPLRAWERANRELLGHPHVRREFDQLARYAQSPR